MTAAYRTSEELHQGAHAIARDRAASAFPFKRASKVKVFPHNFVDSRFLHEEILVSFPSQGDIYCSETSDASAFTRPGTSRVHLCVACITLRKMAPMPDPIVPNQRRLRCVLR